MCVSLGLADSEYTLYTRGAGRVEVIELFEENLKAMGLLKSMSLSVVNSQGDNTRGFRKGQEKVIALVHLHNNSSALRLPHYLLTSWSLMGLSKM